MLFQVKQDTSGNENVRPKTVMMAYPGLTGISKQQQDDVMTLGVIHNLLTAL